MVPTQTHFAQAHDFHIDTQNNVQAENVYQYAGGNGMSPVDREYALPLWVGRLLYRVKAY